MQKPERLDLALMDLLIILNTDMLFKIHLPEITSTHTSKAFSKNIRLEIAIIG